VERIVERVPTAFLAAFSALVLAAAGLGLVWRRERRRARIARREALVDPLTGIPNRLAFHERLSSEWGRARRYGRTLGLLLLDMDGLKQINDEHGHAAGDEAIREIAESITAGTRDYDFAARLAGDEFVVLCPETGGAGLREISEVLRAGLDAQGVGASIGAAEFDAGDQSPEDMLARADMAMYADKLQRSGGAERAVRKRARGHSSARARPALATSASSATRASV
jgi:diguanylate cyclase (GGDEF)-like protein